MTVTIEMITCGCPVINPIFINAMWHMCGIGRRYLPNKESVSYHQIA